MLKLSVRKPEMNFFKAYFVVVIMGLFKNLIERSAFGVCDYVGQRMGVASGRVRTYFIYLTCATLGSSMLPYLFLAFWLNIKRYLEEGKNVIYR